MHDEIKQEIDIDAPVATVWPLVSMPGWWICEGKIDPSIIEDRGDHAIVGGAFKIGYDMGQTEEGTRAGFTWEWINDSDRPKTEVVFDVTALPAGGTRVQLVESGLKNGAGSEELLNRHYEENNAGWAEQLNLLRETAESGT